VFGPLEPSVQALAMKEEIALVGIPQRAADLPPTWP
jgi:hypothetical protein